MYNQETEPRRAEALQFMIESRLPVISQTYIPNEPFYRAYGRETEDPTAVLFFPIFGGEGREGEVIGSLAQEIEWKSFITSVYPPGSEYMDIVIGNSCNQTYTFRVEDLQTTSGRVSTSLTRRNLHHAVRVAQWSNIISRAILF